LRKDEPCDTLFEYANKFIEYVEGYQFVTEEQQRDTLLSLCADIVTSVRDRFFDEIKSAKNITSKQITELFNSVISNIEKRSKDMENRTIDVDFLEKYKNDIYKIIDDVFEKYKTSDKQKASIFNIIISNLCKANNLCNRSGIVIAGYGNEEIFPSIYKCEIGSRIGKSPILFNEEKRSISYEHVASIIPFAQEEMVHTFMGGIDPLFQKTIDERLNDFIMTVSDIIGDSYKSNLVNVKKKFIDDLKDFRKKVFIDPIMAIVASLQKLDLAEMAETLVNLTAFKRHISKDAETVGGPTDVAVITKGDGFVWIKRKHYFDIKMNQSFHQNYFKERP
jgi:nucleoid DNA-binding protein